MNPQNGYSKTENVSREIEMLDSSKTESLWENIGHEVKLRADFEPIMSTFLYATVLNHSTFEGALSFLLASKLDSQVVTSMAIREIIDEAYRADPKIIEAAETDIKAVRKRPGLQKFLHTIFIF